MSESVPNTDEKQRMATLENKGGTIQDESAIVALTRALEREPDPIVRRALAGALSALVKR